MTRINLVDPSVLTDKHLGAEYTEITRISANVLELQSRGITPDQVQIPETFTLNTGHMKFFYNKCRWLQRRYTLLHNEMLARKKSVCRASFISYDSRYDLIKDEWYNEWEPSIEDIYLSMARICKMSKIDKVLEELKTIQTN